MFFAGKKPHSFQQVAQEFSVFSALLGSTHSPARPVRFLCTTWPCPRCQDLCKAGFWCYRFHGLHAPGRSTPPKSLISQPIFFLSRFSVDNFVDSWGEYRARACQARLCLALHGKKAMHRFLCKSSTCNVFVAVLRLGKKTGVLQRSSCLRTCRHVYNYRRKPCGRGLGATPQAYCLVCLPVSSGAWRATGCARPPPGH